jgi:two-component system chemotaxis response regulator CheB
VKKIRVAIVDDSAAQRAALIMLLKEEQGIDVVAEAADGLEAVTMARSVRPDVIVMDVVMPRLDGLQAVVSIMAEAPSRIVLVSAAGDDRLVDLSYRGLEAGAMELIPKPALGADVRAWAKRLAESVRLMSEVPIVGRKKEPSRALTTATKGPTIDVVGLVASTGGPGALAYILEQLPKELPVPILVAQHTAPGFISGLVRWFSRVSKLEVTSAVSGTVPHPGCVYLMAEGCDLEVDVEGVLRTPPHASRLHPSGDRLLSSLARAYGKRAGGVVLTGMGNDGAKGLLAIKTAGGTTLVQDKDSCVVFGMPQAALEAGAANVTLPLAGIPPALISLCALKK